MLKPNRGGRRQLSVSYLRARRYQWDRQQRRCIIFDQLLLLHNRSQSSFFRSMPPESFAAPTPPSAPAGGPVGGSTAPFLAAYLARTLNVNPPNTQRTPIHCHQTTLCPKTTTEIKMLCTGCSNKDTADPPIRGGGRFATRARKRKWQRQREAGAAGSGRERDARVRTGVFPFKTVRPDLASCAPRKSYAPTRRKQYHGKQLTAQTRQNTRHPANNKS